jgi:hypothetical protein
MKLILLLAAIAATTPAVAATVRQVPWTEPFDGRLQCDQSAVIACSVNRPSCGTLIEMQFTQLDIDLGARTVRYYQGDRDLALEEVAATIDERGYNGHITGAVAGGGLTLDWFRPDDPSSPIKFSMTQAEENGYRQTLLGSCRPL